MADDDVVWSEGLRKYLAGLRKERREKARVFLAKAPEFFAFLTDVGYDGPVASNWPEMVDFPFNLKLSYVNVQLDQDFTVNLARYHEDAPGAELLTCSIAREAHKRGTAPRSTEAWLVPTVYLQHCHPEYDLAKLDLRTYEGPFEERLERCLRAWAEVLQNQLWDIITGKRWVEGMYHEWV